MQRKIFQNLIIEGCRRRFHQLNSQGRASRRYHDEMWHGENVMGRNSWRSAETLRFAWKTSQPHRKSSDDLLRQGWAWFSVFFMVLDLEDYCIYSNLYKSFCPHVLVSYRFLHGTAKPEILHPLMMPLSDVWVQHLCVLDSGILCAAELIDGREGNHETYVSMLCASLAAIGDTHSRNQWSCWRVLPEDALFGCTCKLPLGSWIDSTAILQQISMELCSGLPGPMWPRLEP